MMHRHIFLLLASSLFVFSPLFVVAQVEDGVGVPSYPLLGPLVIPCVQGDYKCSLNDLISLLNRIILFLLALSVPFATVFFGYAGFLYMTAKEANVARAKEVFKTVLIGVIIMALSWLVVSTILNAFLNPVYSVPIQNIRPR